MNPFRWVWMLTLPVMVAHAADPGGTVEVTQVPCGTSVLEQVTLTWRIATVLGAPVVTSQVAWRGQVPAPPRALTVLITCADGSTASVVLHPVWPAADGRPGAASSDSPRWSTLFLGTTGPLPATRARTIVREGFTCTGLTLDPAVVAEDTQAAATAAAAARAEAEARIAAQREAEERRQTAERDHAAAAARTEREQAFAAQARSEQAGAAAAAWADQAAAQQAAAAAAARDRAEESLRAQVARNEARVQAAQADTQGAGSSYVDPIATAILEGQRQLQRDLQHMNDQAAETDRMVREAKARKQADADASAAESRRQAAEERQRQQQDLAARQAAAERQRQEQERQQAERERQRREAEAAAAARAEQERRRQEALARARAAQEEKDRIAREKALAAQYADVRYPLNDGRVSDGSWPKGVTTIRNVQIGAARIAELKVGFHFDSLMGEPLVTAITRWTRATPDAAPMPGNPEITLAVINTAGAVAYIVVRPMVVDEGKDSWDVPGSPDWKEMFSDANGTWFARKAAIAAFKSATSVRIARIRIP